MSTNEQARYTAEQVETVARSLDGLSRQMLRAYAKSLNAPAGVVSDAALTLARNAYFDALPSSGGEAANPDAMRAALEAALSAPEPAVQVEAGPVVAWMTKAGRVINTETRERVLADAELGGEYVAAAKAAEAYCIPLYTAPPAQPAEVEATLRRILERGKHRTDGDLSALLDRVEHMTRGDQDLIAMQRTEIRLLDEKAAAERVPEGWLEDAVTWGTALNEAAWAFLEACPEKSARLFNNCKAPLRAAILKYAEKVAASPAPSEGGKGVDRG